MYSSVMHTYPGISCSDILKGSYGRLAAVGAAVVLQNKLVQHHHIRVIQPLSPLRLPGHLRQYGQILVTLSGEKRDQCYLLLSKSYIF